MKLGVVFPWESPFLFSKFVDSALNLRHPAGVEVKWFRGRGWSSARRHIDGCEQAVKWGADLLCIVGADQTYEPDMLERLVARFNEGYEVVAAMVPTRGFVGQQGMKPFEKMAWRFKAATPTADGNVYGEDYQGFQDSQHMLEKVNPHGEPMERVHFIGSGVVLFHRDHLLSLERPWFSEMINPETYVRISNMDTRWLWGMQNAAGVQCWVDTTIQVKHLHIFEIDESFQERFADWEHGEGSPELAICNYHPMSTLQQGSEDVRAASTR